MSEVLTKEDLMSSFGIQVPTAEMDEDPPETDPPAEDEIDEDAPNDEADVDATEEDDNAEPPADEPEQPAKPAAAKDPMKGLQSKDAAAFAKMRIQNTQFSAALKGIADQLNLDVNVDQETLLATIQNVVLQAKAKSQGTSPEVLAELEGLRADRLESQKVTRYTKSKDSLLALQDKYSIPDDDLPTFLDELLEADLDPREVDVDFEMEYLRRHQKEITENAVAKALADAKVLTDKNNRAPGTLPGKGKQVDTSKRIETVADLDALFKTIEL